MTDLLPGGPTLEALAASDDPSLRAAGRCMAAGFSEALSKWIEEETQLNTPPRIVVTVFAETLVQLAASLAVHSATPERFEEVRKKFDQAFDRSFLRHAHKVHAYLNGSIA